MRLNCKSIKLNITAGTFANSQSFDIHDTATRSTDNKQVNTVHDFCDCKSPPDAHEMQTVLISQLTNQYDQSTTEPPKINIDNDVIQKHNLSEADTSKRGFFDVTVTRSSVSEQHNGRLETKDQT